MRYYNEAAALLLYFIQLFKDQQLTNGSKIPFVDNQKGVTMLCTFVAFSLVLINSVVSEVDPDDEKFATVSQNTGKE